MKIWKGIREEISNSSKWLLVNLEKHPISMSLTLILFIFLSWIVWETVKANNTDFEKKSLWDWMDLLLVPIILAIGGFLFNRAQKNNELKIANENREEDQDIAKANRESDIKIAEDRIRADRQNAQQRQFQNSLESYFDRITELLLPLFSENEDPDYLLTIKPILRMRTLTVLKNLDGQRKGQVLKFLYDTELISGSKDIKLTGADFSNLILEENSIFDSSILNECDFSKSRLMKLSLKNVSFEGCDFDNAELNGSNFNNANLANGKFKNAKLIKAEFENTDLTSAILTNAQLNESFLSGAILIKASMYNANLTNVSLINANLEEAKLHNATLRGADLWKTNLTKAKLVKSKLRNSSRQITSLSESILVDANLTGADCTGVDFTGANLSGAILRNAILKGAKISESQLKSARNIDGLEL